ncbi:MAG: hypothetical protein WAQ24_04225 [Candidatus Saccharimonadales bacterium]
MSIDEILRPEGVGTETVLPCRPTLLPEHIKAAANEAFQDGFEAVAAGQAVEEQ